MSKTDPLSRDGVSLLRRLYLDYGRHHVGTYAITLVMMAMVAGITSVLAYLLKPILNNMMDASGFRELRAISWGITALFILRGFATFGYLVLLSRVGNRIIADVQKRLFDHLLAQDLGFFQNRHSSEFMSRLALAANGVRDSLQVLVTGAGRDTLTLIGLLINMVIQDPLLTLVSLAGLPIGAGFLSRLRKKVRTAARRSFLGSTTIMETMQEAVQGLRLVKSFNLNGLMRDRMGLAVREVERSANRVATGAAWSSPLADSMAGVVIGGVIFYGSWRVTIAGADPGSFVSFVVALMLAYDPAKRLARLNLDIQNGLVGARMIYEVLDEPAREVSVPGTPALAVTEGRIVAEGVRFGYRTGEAVLDGFSFVAEPSATTALVGPSGGGKSTVLSLLQRFYEPEAGRILIDGQPIHDVDRASLREAVAFVSQDPFLFRGSIRDNIAMGRPDATEADIVEAAVQAHAHDFISGFAQGYDTPVGEHGMQLSGGQRQRIAIARAIVKRAPILLLDEPTAALDSESEREVQRALDEARVGRTTLVVAHRLQTIIKADRICVIDRGRVVESGTHAELMARRGSYHSFFAAQFGNAGSDPAELIRPLAAAPR